MLEQNQIIFTLNKEGYVAPENTLENIPQEEIIKLSHEGFFFKGEKVDDIHNVYERFNDWLSKAELQANKE